MTRSRTRQGAARPGCLAAAAAIVLLGGCESGRVAAPDVRPSPAENVAAAAGALEVDSRPDVLRAQAGLAAHVTGWREPAPTAGGPTPDVRLDAETAARVERLQTRMRSYVAQRRHAPVEPR